MKAVSPGRRAPRLAGSPLPARSVAWRPVSVGILLGPPPLLRTVPKPHPPGPGRAGRPVSDPEAVRSRRLRAAEEPLDVRIRATEPFVRLEVLNPIHRTRYRVFLPLFPQRDTALCTCPDFARRGLGTCKHLEAVWSWLGTPPRLSGEVPAGPAGPSAERLWKEIDRRLVDLARSPPQGILDVDRPGDALWEVPHDGTIDPENEGSGEKVGRPRPRRTEPTPTSRARP
jgi:hypothetical protein